MNFDDVKAKYQRKNKILFSRESLCLQELIALICKQKHRTIVMWILQWANQTADILNKRYPDEERFNNAIVQSTRWAMGKIKMPIAKKAILDCHKVAKEIDNPIDIALCHAIGQACSSVHVETHAIGFVFYDLTALVLELGIDNFEAAASNKIEQYINTLKLWESEIDNYSGPWASFLLNDNKINKELFIANKKADK